MLLPYFPTITSHSSRATIPLLPAPAARRSSESLCALPHKENRMHVAQTDFHNLKKSYTCRIHTFRVNLSFKCGAMDPASLMPYVVSHTVNRLAY